MTIPARASPLLRNDLQILSLMLQGLHLEQQAAHADDAVHGSPDLMAHIGQKTALGLAGSLRGLLGFAQCLPFAGLFAAGPGDR